MDVDRLKSGGSVLTEDFFERQDRFFESDFDRLIKLIDSGKYRGDDNS